MQQQGWKSDGESKHCGGKRSRPAKCSLQCTQGAHVTRRNECTPAKPERDGKTCTSRRPLQRHRSESARPAPWWPRYGLPAGTCGRGGADSYPSQYPHLPGCRVPTSRLTAPAARRAGGYRPHWTVNGPGPRWAGLVARPAGPGRYVRNCGQPRLPTASRPWRWCPARWPTRKPLRPAGRRTTDSESAAARRPPYSAKMPPAIGMRRAPARLAVAWTARPAGRQTVRRRHRRSG